MPPTERYMVATIEDNEQKFMTFNTESAAMSQARAWAQDDLSEPVFIAKVIAAYNIDPPTEPVLTNYLE